MLLGVLIEPLLLVVLELLRLGVFTVPLLRDDDEPEELLPGVL